MICLTILQVELMKKIQKIFIKIYLITTKIIFQVKAHKIKNLLKNQYKNQKMIMKNPKLKFLKNMDLTYQKEKMDYVYYL